MPTGSPSVASREDLIIMPSTALLERNSVNALAYVCKSKTTVKVSASFPAIMA